MNQHPLNEHPPNSVGGCGPFTSLGEIGLLIVTTAVQNLALTGRRTAELRSRQARNAREATAPRSH
ncbi:hypothetical protein AB0I94_08525 [Streptomyces sp. NPDC050147]|uniref:hypothetical protein n=1 Tax=Streptomyces sp. NPDC050147 TaxID=3155513 RepID=UPI00343CDF83